VELGSIMASLGFLGIEEGCDALDRLFQGTHGKQMLCFSNFV
jgi:hypothetical protein